MQIQGVKDSVQLARRDYMSNGSEYTDTQAKRDKLQSVVDGLEWETFGVGLQLPAMPGMAIETAIKEYRIPRVSRVAVSHEYAPYGFCAVTGNYKNGTADVYLIDDGCSVRAIAADFTQRV